MSDSTTAVPGSAVRTLPAHANLEFERKRAKALLRRLRATDPQAKLADAQFAVARELGFASWPRLVQYFAVLEREALTMRSFESGNLEFYDGQARSILTEHQVGREWAGRAMAAYVPRFYGRSIAEVLALQATIDDARIVIARRHQCSSWDQLIESASQDRARRGDPWVREGSPYMRATRAIARRDVGALEDIVDRHPELLQPSADDEQHWRTLMFSALIGERQTRTPAARRVTDWLVSRGMDLTVPLNSMLLGFINISVEEVQYLLDRGADVSWMPPNGVSILEHAILRYMNGRAVDLVAQRVAKHPRGLWAAAGLGDVTAVRSYFDRRGTPTAAAYENRPPFYAMPGQGFPALPEPDDLEILIEVGYVAAINGRAEVLEVLIDRGLPIDYSGWGGTSLLRFAIGQRDVPVLEMLLRRGADLDRKGEWPFMSAREFARDLFKRHFDGPEVGRILELCGVETVEALRAEADRGRPSPPPVSERFRQALALAGDDAARRGRADAGIENLLIGVLRAPTLPVSYLAAAGVDVGQLQATLGGRLLPATDRVSDPSPPLDAAALGIVDRAIAIADSKRRAEVHSLELLSAMAELAPNFASDLIVACGGDLALLRKQLVKV